MVPSLRRDHQLDKTFQELQHWQCWLDIWIRISIEQKSFKKLREFLCQHTALAALSLRTFAPPISHSNYFTNLLNNKIFVHELDMSWNDIFSFYTVAFYYFISSFHFEKSEETNRMSEDIEKHVVKKFEICQRLGKGVSLSWSLYWSLILFRPTVLFGKLLKSVLEVLLH